MEISDRIQRAMDSQLGAVLLVTLLLLLLMGCVYLVLMMRQKRRDLLAFQHRSFYQRAEEIASPFQFTGTHRADLFGRVSSVLCCNGSYALCTIPSPDMIDPDVLDRFRSLSRAIRGRKLSLFASHLWLHDEELLVLVQGQLLQRDGTSRLHLQRYLSDKRLGRAYAEQILIEVAKALAELHRRRTESGCHLYHGLLLPRSLFLDFDAARTINRISIADLGLVYAFGPERMWRLLQCVRSAKLPMERFLQSDLLEQMAMLAPEQRDDGRLGEVGTPSDFYSFAALACAMFTQRRFRGSGGVVWESVPSSWQPFLRQCLDDNPRSRPTDFMDIHDWIEDPDLVLSGQLSCEEEGISTARQEQHQLEDLAGMLERVQTRTVLSAAQRTNGQDERSLGFNALKSGRWKKAKEHLLAAGGEDAELCVSLAIVYYELGDLENAEKQYHKAKGLDPSTARCFREHIAFRV